MYWTNILIQLVPMELYFLISTLMHSIAAISIRALKILLQKRFQFPFILSLYLYSFISTIEITYINISIYIRCRLTAN